MTGLGLYVSLALPVERNKQVISNSTKLTRLFSKWWSLTFKVNTSQPAERQENNVS